MLNIFLFSMKIACHVNITYSVCFAEMSSERKISGNEPYKKDVKVHPTGRALISNYVSNSFIMAVYEKLLFSCALNRKF